MNCYFICKKDVITSEGDKRFTKGEAYGSKSYSEPYDVINDLRQEQIINNERDFLVKHFTKLTVWGYKHWVQHQSLLGAEIEGKLIKNGTFWVQLDNPNWCWTEITYRVKTSATQVKRNKILKAYKAGTAVQYKRTDNVWETGTNLGFHWDDFEYRVHPDGITAKEAMNRESVMSKREEQLTNAKKAHAQGLAVQSYSESLNQWRNIEMPGFFKSITYRVHPEGITIKEVSRRIAIEEQHAKGATVQFRFKDSATWNPASTPSFNWSNLDYRVKEEWTFVNHEGHKFQQHDFCYLFTNKGMRISLVTKKNVSKHDLFTWHSTKEKALMAAAKDLLAKNIELARQGELLKCYIDSKS